MEMRTTPFEINANILPMPAVILLVIASRGFIFWCLNILSIPLIISNGKEILYGNKRKTDSIDDRDFQYQRNQAHNSNILEVINMKILIWISLHYKNQLVDREKNL